MNYDYARRAQTVQAFQMTRERRADNREWPAWLDEAWNRKAWDTDSVFPEHGTAGAGKDRVVVCSNSSAYSDIVEWGSWIVRDEQGRFVVLNDHQFSSLYASLEAAKGFPDGAEK